MNTKAHQEPGDRKAGQASSLPGERVSASVAPAPPPPASQQASRAAGQTFSPAGPLAFRLSVPLAAPLRDVKLLRSGDREMLRQADLAASYERGRLDGERALGEQLVRQRADVMQLQTGLLASLREAIPQVVREGERALVALALEAAQKLVSGLPISVEMIEAAVKEACAQVEDTAEFTVQLHPDDLHMLEQTNSPLLLPQGGHERIRFQPSAHVTRGGCVVQTRFGVIDNRRETKMELLQKAVMP